MSAATSQTDTRTAKSRALKALLHQAFNQNQDPNWPQIRELKTLLMKQGELDPKEQANISTKMLSKWFRDQRYYRKRYGLK